MCEFHLVAFCKNSERVGAFLDQQSVARRRRAFCVTNGYEKRLSNIVDEAVSVNSQKAVDHVMVSQATGKTTGLLKVTKRVTLSDDNIREAKVFLNAADIAGKGIALDSAVVDDLDRWAKKHGGQGVRNARSWFDKKTRIEIKIYRTQGDQRVREEHAILEGRRFRIDDIRAPEPPLDYNCRCYYDYDFADAASFRSD